MLSKVLTLNFADKISAITSSESIHTKRISNCFFMGKPAAYCSSCFILPMTNLWIARRKAGWQFFQTWLGFHQDFAYIIFRFKCMKEPIFIERLIDMHAKTIASESNHRRKGLECLFQISSIPSLRHKKVSISVYFPWQLENNILKFC